MRSIILPGLLILIVILICQMDDSTFAQKSAKSQKPPQMKVETIAPSPADVATLDGIIAAFYDVISGPAGQPRQWARDRTLYLPGIRFIAVDVRDGKPQAVVMDHQTYVDSADAYMVKEGFFEREVKRVTQQYDNIAQVFSTYETRNKADGPVIARGINSIELYFDGSRWWITSATWEDEQPDKTILR